MCAKKKIIIIKAIKKKEICYAMLYVVSVSLSRRDHWKHLFTGW